MIIGDGPDCYDGINKEEDEQIKRQETVEKWWHTLLYDNYKYELLEPYYPNELNFMAVDDAWNGLDWNDKWEIYKDEHE